MYIKNSRPGRALAHGAISKHPQLPYALKLNEIVTSNKGSPFEGMPGQCSRTEEPIIQVGSSPTHREKDVTVKPRLNPNFSSSNLLHQCSLGSTQARELYQSLLKSSKIHHMPRSACALCSQAFENNSLYMVPLLSKSSER